MYIRSKFLRRKQQPPVISLEVVNLGEQPVYKPGPVGLP